MSKFACGQVSSPRLYRLRPQFELRDILDFFSQTTFSRKLFILKIIYESIPTAWGLKDDKVTAVLKQQNNLQGLNGATMTDYRKTENRATTNLANH